MKYPRLCRGIFIPNAEWNKQVYPVSEKISSKVASLIEPFTVGCRASRRSMPKPGEKAIVFGAGTIGIAAAIALQYFGCKQVMVCDHSDFRLEKTKALGFAVCNNGKENLKTAAMAYFGEAPSLSGTTADVDIYIDAAGAESILEMYADIRDIRFENEFDVVLNLADGAIGYLETDEENLKIFDAISRALKSEGKHFMDICNAEHAEYFFPKSN